MPRHAKKWYVLAVEPEAEHKVARALTRAALVAGCKPLLGKVLVPTRPVTSVVKGRRVTVPEVLYPGYVVAEMHFTDDLFHLIDGLDKCFGTLPLGTSKPTSLDTAEAALLLLRCRASVAAAKEVKVSVSRGDAVSIKDGAFRGHSGTVTGVKGSGTPEPTVVVAVEILGRPVPVELRPWQVAKA